MERRGSRFTTPSSASPGKLVAYRPDLPVQFLVSALQREF
jgi:hypothetical protein